MKYKLIYGFKEFTVFTKGGKALWATPLEKIVYKLNNIQNNTVDAYSFIEFKNNAGNYKSILFNQTFYEL